MNGACARPQPYVSDRDFMKARDTQTSQNSHLLARENSSIGNSGEICAGEIPWFFVVNFTGDGVGPAARFAVILCRTKQGTRVQK
jgi:hypothetical protein